MIVLTVDQRSSTTRGDLVPQVLELLSARTTRHGAPADGVLLPFERTVGDEVQGVFGDDAGAHLAVEVVADLLRDGGWSIGIGVGAVDEPLAAVARAASGPAFVRARSAVESAKLRGTAVPLAVVGADADPAATIASDTEAVLRLLGALAARRTDAGWAAIDTLTSHGGVSAPQRAAAAQLGVTEQAVSQRLRTALWSEELAARPLAARLLRAADAAATASDTPHAPVGTPEQDDDEE